MPFGRIRRRPVLVGLTTVLAVATMPALASASSCGTAPTTKAFGAFGDSSNYSLAPAGAFEDGAPGWSLSNASVGSGSESHKLHGAGDTKSLAIASTGVAVSPPFCVSIAEPSFRFVARRTSGSWAAMNVGLRWTDARGVSHDTTAGSVGGSTNWQPSQIMALGAILPLWMPNSTVSVRLVFNPEDFGGAWAIDDVYIDPYSR